MIWVTMSPPVDSRRFKSILTLSYGLLCFVIASLNNIEISDCSQSHLILSRPENLEVRRYGELPDRHNNLDLYFAHHIATTDQFRHKSAQETLTKLNRHGKRYYFYPPSHLQPDGARRSTSVAKALPNGPPPFTPSMILPQASVARALSKLKRTKIFKRMYKSKVYYLFLDALRQLTLLADKISRKKIDITKVKLATLQAAINKFAWKGGHSLKLQWPLVMLNPNFLKEILSNPTYLVMLFHAIEVAYMSMPVTFWLKPLVKLVKQPSPEKEEQIWWRRKRIYDTLNGHGTSEMQPNMKAVHFRNPGEPTPIAMPRLVNFVRTLTGRPQPSPENHYPIDSMASAMTTSSAESYAPYHLDEGQSASSSSSDKDYMTSGQQEAFFDNQIHYNRGRGVPTSLENTPTRVEPQHGGEGPQDWQQSETDLPTWDQQHEMHNLQAYGSQISISPTAQDDWLTQLPSREQLMSQSEFDSLDEKDKELILNEAKRRFEESSLANEFIKQQNDIVELFAQRQDNLFAVPMTNDPQATAQSEVREDLAAIEAQPQTRVALERSFPGRGNNRLASPVAIDRLHV